MARMTSTLLWVAALVLVIAVTVQATVVGESNDLLESGDALTRGKSRFLLHSYGSTRPTYSCRYSLKVCTGQRTHYGQKKFKRAGCCENRCVDLTEDKSNCGKCGKKCTYSSVCCSGRCTQIYGNDCENCGGCGKRCPNGSKCKYGICGYNSGGRNHGHGNEHHDNKKDKKHEKEEKKGGRKH